MGIEMNNLKLVAYIERVKRLENKRLVGSIVIVDSELVISSDDELCYEDLFGVRHAVNNVEILGVL